MVSKPVTIMWRHYLQAALKGGASRRDMARAKDHFLAGAATAVLSIDRILQNDDSDFDDYGFMLALYAQAHEIAEQMDFQLMHRRPSDPVQ